MDEWSLYLSLFWAFFKIGLFGFGGGYAMISLIQHEVVEVHHWISVSDFTDIVAISQTTPGPIAFNTATYIGYTATGSVWGSAVCTLAVSLPSIILMTLVCRFFFMFRDNAYVAAILGALKPTVIGLIAAAALLLMNGRNFEDYKKLVDFWHSFSGFPEKSRSHTIDYIGGSSRLFPILEPVSGISFLLPEGPLARWVSAIRFRFAEVLLHCANAVV